MGAPSGWARNCLSESGCEHCIIRVQWTYGKGGVNFITKISKSRQNTENHFGWLMTRLARRLIPLEVGKAICDFLEMDEFPVGLFHFAAGGSVSRYEMTRFLFEVFGIKTPVNPCKTSEFKTAARRPLNSCFDCRKIEDLLGRQIPTWQDMLKSYLETL